MTGTQPPAPAVGDGLMKCVCVGEGAGCTNKCDRGQLPTLPAMKVTLPTPAVQIAAPAASAPELRAPRHFGGKTKPLALCPASCGCLWVNNGDGSMSLFSVNSKSCDECELLPWDQLLPVSFSQQPAQPAAPGDVGMTSTLDWVMNVVLPEFPNATGHCERISAALRSQGQADAVVVPAPDVSRLLELFAFLDGTEPFGGVWFGEVKPLRGGPYWWRTELRELSQPLRDGLSSPQPAALAQQAKKGGK